MGLTKKVIDMGQTIYCEMVHKIVFVNASWGFTALWKIAKLFVHELTRKKISIVGSGYASELAKYIDADQIPSEYEGTNTEPLEWGVSPKFFPKTQPTQATN